jgi:hypothetical protein
VTVSDETGVVTWKQWRDFRIQGKYAGGRFCNFVHVRLAGIEPPSVDRANLARRENESGKQDESGQPHHSA